MLDPSGRTLLLSGEQRTRIHPGSTLKPLVASALLDARAAAPVRCSGRFFIGDRNLSCSHPRPLGMVALEDAIAYSCNEYFAHAAAERLRPGQLSQRLRQFGLNASTPSTPDQAMLLALGEWGVECTALELAQAYLRLSKLPYPRIGEALKTAATVGTARLAGGDVSGKTGTSPNRSRTGSWALFAGWSPAAKPRVVLAVMVSGGRGATEAAPVARTLFDKYVEQQG